MDKHYFAAIITVGVLGVLGIIGGVVIICTLKDSQATITAGMACIGIGGAVASGVIGSIITPRSAPTVPTPPDTTGLAALQTAVDQAADTLKKGAQ